MKFLSIAFAMLVGLVSLFVSVCGGGFFVALTYNSLRAVLIPTGTQSFLAVMPSLIFAAGCATGGGWVLWQCIKFIRRQASERK